TLTSLVNITSSTSINGGGKITLSGGHTNKIFIVSGSGLTLTNITLADGRSTFGGCITAAGSLTIVQSILRNCHSTTGGLFGGAGGALAIVGANLSMSNTQILSNVAELNGGGI